MFLGCHFVYDLAEAEIVVRDMVAHNETFYYGQALKCGSTDGTDLGTVTSAGAGSGLLVGMSNEGGINDGGRVLAGTVAAGTSELLKVIVNPNGVYRCEYDQSSPITWSAVGDTSIAFTCANGEGHPNIGGGWAWSYNTGKLDWIVSSSTTTTTCTLVTVTGTDTSSTTGILMYPQGKYVVELNSTGRKIAAGEVDLGVAKTNGFNAVILGNQIVSSTMAVEKLVPATNATIPGQYNVPGTAAATPTNRMNRTIRHWITQTTSGKTMDKARAFADVHFGPANVWSQVS